jgi:hypothetical protein
LARWSLSILERLAPHFPQRTRNIRLIKEIGVFEHQTGQKLTHGHDFHDGYDNILPRQEQEMSRPTSYFHHEQRLFNMEQTQALLAKRVAQVKSGRDAPVEASDVSGLAQKPTASAGGGDSTGSPVLHLPRDRHLNQADPASSGAAAYAPMPRGSLPNSLGTEGSSHVAKPIASGSGASGGDTVRLGVPAVLDSVTAASLVWLTPVRHANTEATQTSQCGRYAVFGRRSPQGFVFIARAGLEPLGEPQRTAEEARALCEQHHRESP